MLIINRLQAHRVGSPGSYLPQYVDFQRPKLAVGDDQEVSAAARGVEEAQ